MTVFHEAPRSAGQWTWQRWGAAVGLGLILLNQTIPAADFSVTETAEEIRLETPRLQAAIRKQGYVSGVARQTLVDKRTGFRDPGFGLDIVDWIMEPGSDRPYRERLHPELGRLKSLLKWI